MFADEICLGSGTRRAWQAAVRVRFWHPAEQAGQRGKPGELVAAPVAPGEVADQYRPVSRGDGADEVGAKIGADLRAAPYGCVIRLHAAGAPL
jgi:hypothetical protein